MPNADSPAKRDTASLLWLGVATVALLLPFAGKAFNIDDPIFVWTAEQIADAPADFFGFAVNWYGVAEPMHAINKNPPLVSYWLAAVGSLSGWSEVSLHIGMLLPAVLGVLGVAALARELGADPRVAAAVAATTPVFMVSATSVMSDVPMLALWCWALVFFVRGCRDGLVGDLAMAGVVIGLAVLAKYFALALLPLAVAYGAVRTKRLGSWLLPIVIACAIVLAFDVYTHARYGLHPIVDVIGYATKVDVPYRLPLAQRAAAGLFFLGGCCLGTLLFAPWLWSRRELAIGVFAGGLIAALCVSAFEQQGLSFDLHLQQALFALAGLQLVALAAHDLVRTRSPEAMLLALWLAGVLVFAAFTNWTTNGRSILPAVPAIGLLIARGLERRDRLRTAVVAPVVAVSLVVALAVAAADAQLAGSAREAARHYAGQASQEHELYFQGSWGFQRYMEQAGVAKLAVGETVLEPGDRIVMPGNNTNLIHVPLDRAEQIALETFEKSSWISILAHRRSAGFHASVWGSLPFSFGPTVPERYAVYEFKRSWAPKRRGGRRVRGRARD